MVDTWSLGNLAPAKGVHMGIRARPPCPPEFRPRAALWRNSPRRASYKVHARVVDLLRTGVPQRHGVSSCSLLRLTSSSGYVTSNDMHPAGISIRGSEIPSMCVHGRVQRLRSALSHSPIRQRGSLDEMSPVPKRAPLRTSSRSPPFPPVSPPNPDTRPPLGTVLRPDPTRLEVPE